MSPHAFNNRSRWTCLLLGVVLASLAAADEPTPLSGNPAPVYPEDARYGLITGDVWFRAWVLQEANARGLDGWVRNRRDGAVEAVFLGQASAVEDMIAACHDGPPAARVIQVVRFDDAGEVEPGFHFRPSR